MKSCLHLLAATALCMIAAQTATAVQAKTMIIGLDMSGSNDLVTVPEHAANVADVIDRQIKKMDLGDRVVVLSTRPAQVAADLSITEPRPRSAAWHRSTEAQRLEEKILAVLHGQHGHGHLRVSG